MTLNNGMKWSIRSKLHDHEHAEPVKPVMIVLDNVRVVTLFDDLNFFLSVLAGGFPFAPHIYFLEAEQLPLFGLDSFRTTELALAQVTHDKELLTFVGNEVCTRHGWMECVSWVWLIVGLVGSQSLSVWCFCRVTPLNILVWCECNDRSWCFQAILGTDEGSMIPPPIIPNIDFEADIEKDATFGKLYIQRDVQNQHLQNCNERKSKHRNVYIRWKRVGIWQQLQR